MIAGKRLRPFSQSSGVKCRSYSLPLQRVIVDFGADTSFKDTKKKVNEHYAIDLPESSIQIITEKHAKNMLSIEFENKSCDTEVNYLISETDGVMVPIVETEVDENMDKGTKIDRRKYRKIFWKEARLCFSRRVKSLKKVFSAVLGSVDETGDALYKSACRVGFDENTQVHGIGDGAPWIVKQFDRVFADQSDYLIDFFHLSEYISKAAQYFNEKQPDVWRKQQQSQLKENKFEEVLEELNQKIQLEDWEDPEHPVVACYRYMNNRKTHFDYAGALEKDLPIGSGEIESSHRYVIQKRLKIPGSWWKKDNARAMIALRVVRVNEDWEFYWRQVELKTTNESAEFRSEEMLNAA